VNHYFLKDGRCEGGITNCVEALAFGEVGDREAPAERQCECSDRFEEGGEEDLLDCGEREAEMKANSREGTERELNRGFNQKRGLIISASSINQAELLLFSKRRICASFRAIPHQAH
jgi:hypothetical protein